MEARGWTTLLLLGGAIACDSGTPTAPKTPTASVDEPPPLASATPSSPAPAPAAAHAWVGRWSSSSCAERGYERVVTLEADGRVIGRDNVAPCPPGARCVWSGIIDWTGRWAAAHDGLALELDDVQGNPAMKPLPTRLRWIDGVLAEPSTDAPCRYTRTRP